MFAIVCNRSNPDTGHQELSEVISKLGQYWRCSETTWCLKTDQRADQILNQLSRIIETGDSVIIAKLSNEVISMGINMPAWLLTRNG